MRLSRYSHIVCDMSKIKYFRIVVITAFFLSLLIFAITFREGVFNSPDENANALFALQLANSNSLTIPIMYEDAWSILVHPRSTIVVKNFVVPVSFVGFSALCGLFIMIFGDWVMLLFTPALAVFCIITWRKIIFSLFNNNRLADLSAIFLIIHPAFWYYSGRVMMHNVVFISFLIFSAYFFICKPFNKIVQSREYINIILSGVFLGLALFCRASEGLWVLGIVAGLFIYYRKSISAKYIILWSASLAIALIPFFVINNSLYGSPLLTGYGAQYEVVSEATGVQVGQGVNYLSVLFDFIFPFGIHEMNILRNVFRYIFLLYPWMSILAIAGLIYVFKQKQWRTYIVITLIMSAWLACVYGSWNFHDNPDADALTIGNSYVRYWLPVFVMMSAFCALCIDKILSIKLKKSGIIIGSTIIIVAMLLSANLVILGEDGFVQTAKNINSFEHKKQIILEQTAEESIIIADMADKYLFPQRQVVVPLRNDDVYASIPSMLDATQVYYFGITIPKIDIEYLENVVFGSSNVKLREVVTIEDETLYQFINTD